ncbi:hypothetical protein LCGC14_3077570 [marine sediment metagenome]|uniref:Uncharacterized protein n=1 Tax=marine sediment metagenome TaxID=412755 RepID=A0A0F8Z4Y0_9ZZZZ
MKWRCLNSIFGYCTSTPEPEVSPNIAGKDGEYTYFGGKCRLSPNTCGKYQVFSEVMAGVGPIGGNFRHTQVGKKKAKAKKGGKE